ncbi:MAG: hypothetical protein KGH79_05240 [Patescibacteria group bacterium]|nr:hypothetical protein [Patescibacteria group bacterium]
MSLGAPCTDNPRTDRAYLDTLIETLTVHFAKEESAYKKEDIAEDGKIPGHQ